MASSASINNLYGGTYELTFIMSEDEGSQTLLTVADGDDLSVSLAAFDDDGNNLVPNTFVDEDKREDLILFFKQAIAMLERKKVTGQK